MPSEPVRRDGVWWVQQDDQSWLRWDEATNRWVTPDPSMPFPPPADAPPAAPLSQPQAAQPVASTPAPQPDPGGAAGSAASQPHNATPSAAKSGNGSKLPLPAIIGVVVVAALAIGAYVLFAGGDSSDDDGLTPRISRGVADELDGEDESISGEAGEEAEVRYLSMGDSLTQGIGADDDDGAFPARLAERWRDAGCTVDLLNAGISGYTAAQIISDQLPNVADFRPTIITFQTGANDIANGVTERDYRRNVGKILDEAVDSGAEVYVLYQNEWDRSPDGPSYGGTRQLRETYNKILEEEAKSRGLEMMDLRSIYKKQADNKEWVDDGLHPTADAYDEWAEALFDRIPLPCDS